MCYTNSVDFVGSARKHACTYNYLCIPRNYAINSKSRISNFKVQTAHDAFTVFAFSCDPRDIQMSKNTAQLEFKFIRPLHIFECVSTYTCVSVSCVYAYVTYIRCVHGSHLQNSFNRTNFESIEIYLAVQRSVNSNFVLFSFFSPK